MFKSYPWEIITSVDLLRIFEAEVIPEARASPGPRAIYSQAIARARGRTRARVRGGGVMHRGWY